MPNDVEQAAQRFQIFGQQVIETAIWPAVVSAPVWVAAQSGSEAGHCTGDNEVAPVRIGWRWGPVWSSATFRIEGKIPTEWAGRQVGLRFSCGTEAIVLRAGQALCGLGPNHDWVPLFLPAQGGEHVNLSILASCNRPLGATFFWWDERELAARWQEDKPGRLERCEWAVRDEAVWRLFQAFDFARQLLVLQPADSERGRRLIDGLDRACHRLIGAESVSTAAESVRDEIVALLRGDGGARTRCYAVGHAHIDTAWLWRIGETRRKCRRTFATVLDLFRQQPAFRFVASQAIHYAWTSQDDGELGERIDRAVAAGQWEPGGAMWIEPDGNVPSGESFIRQILHGTRYWESRFGADGRQTYLYLPDTFGFTAILPQIMRGAGLDTFITNKLIWSDANEFPHVNFVWRGIDGSEVTAHCTPGRDYNSQNTPRELLRGERDSARLDSTRSGIWLQPFGHGDGGGGPTAESIERAILSADCEGMPRVQLASVRDFVAALREARKNAEDQGRDWPVWDGELYLEYHRGTLTTQAKVKQANRRAEELLRRAEWLTAGAPTPLDNPTRLAEALDEAWKRVLLNQFHDILPGSSIREVYEDATRDHVEVITLAAGLSAEGIVAWQKAVNAKGLSNPAVVFNATSAAAGGVVASGFDLHYVENVPALGAALVDLDQLPMNAAPVTVTDGRVLDNGRIRVMIDDAGRIASLRTLPDGREWCAAPVNQLVLYDDRPRSWEAWDIDREHEQFSRPVTDAAERIEVLRSDRLRCEIQVLRSLGTAGRITQIYRLDAGSPRLDILTSVDWQARRTLLRVLFPVAVRARKATYDLSFGHLERPTHRNTPWDRAAFEVCAHCWMDLSELAGGVAVLNNGKYGHSCHGSTMGLTLLRSPMFPAEDADRGHHAFTYSVMPHAGDWRAAGVDRQAALLNEPLEIKVIDPAIHSAGGRSDTATSVLNSNSRAWAPVEVAVHGGAAVDIAALKRSEDGDRLILRLVETHGGRGVAVIRWNVAGRDVRAVDLLERDAESGTNDSGSVTTAGGDTIGTGGVVHDDANRVTVVELRPFGIVTLAARDDA